MQMKNILIAVAVLTTVLALGACATEPTPAAAPVDEFAQLASQVEFEIAAADQAGYLWRDTEKLVNDAKTARGQGKTDEAMALLRKALRQTQLAQKQARDNVNAGPAF
jgi:hypothetical protein